MDVFAWDVFVNDFFELGFSVAYFVVVGEEVGCFDVVLSVELFDDDFGVHEDVDFIGGVVFGEVQCGDE